MKPKIGILDKNRESIVETLNSLLSDEYVLYTKTRNYHWNVLGLHFHDLHKFFEAQYEELDEIIDEVAERARSLGGRSFGTLTEFSKRTHIKEYPAQVPSALKMIENLLADHEIIIQNLRPDVEKAAKLGDAGTSDFLTGLMEQHEKMSWMLRSCLAGK